MSSIKLPHASGNSMSIAAPASNPASDLTLTLPTTIGSNGKYMKVDGSGNLGWERDAYWVFGTPTSAGSGNAYTVTGIPSTAKRVVLTMDSCSGDGTATLRGQLGKSAGFVETGYKSAAGYFYSNNAAYANAGNTDYNFEALGWTSAANLWSGVWSLYKSATNIWCWHSHIQIDAQPYVNIGQGRLDVGGDLDRIRLVWSSGSVDFDGGTVTVDYLTT